MSHGVGRVLFRFRLNHRVFLPKSSALPSLRVGEQGSPSDYPGPDGKFGRLVTKEIDSQLNPIGIDPSDPAGKDDIQLGDQLIIPAHRPIVVQVTSMDVIHSFSLPVMRVKQDAIPGMSIPIGFEAKMTSMEFKKQEYDNNRQKYDTDAEGNERENKGPWHVPDHEIACAQLCGAQHFKMVGKFYIASSEDFTDFKSYSDFSGWVRKFRHGEWNQLKEGATGD